MAVEFEVAVARSGPSGRRRRNHRDGRRTVLVVRRTATATGITRTRPSASLLLVLSLLSSCCCLCRLASVVDAFAVTGGVQRSSSSPLSLLQSTTIPQPPQQEGPSTIRANKAAAALTRRHHRLQAFKNNRGETQQRRDDSDDASKRRQRRRRPRPGDVLVAKAMASVSVGALLFLASLFQNRVPTANAADYGSFTEEQKVVAEAWRLVDNSFLDRTFNHQDWFQLRQDYVLKQARQYKTMEQAQDAIQRMVSSLGDKYTRYLPPAKYQSIVDSATGTLAGVGIEISTNPEGRPAASDLEEGSPAKLAGIRPNDVFVEVDGTKFDTSSTPDDVATKLRGPPNSRVGVVMERDGKIQDYILTRQPITITAVKSYTSNVPSVGKVGVIRIKSFSGTTADTVKEKWSELRKQGVSNFVLDLRGNPGGLLPGGVDTASLFLDADRPVVFVVNKNSAVDAQSTYQTGIDLTSPLVVLVDRNTASAAEVFTAAVKENDRATVVGENTFGKGVVQTVRSLQNGEQGGIAITVARYETPQHHDINKQGIPADIPTPVDCPKDDATACLNPSVFKQAQTQVSKSN